MWDKAYLAMNRLYEKQYTPRPSSQSGNQALHILSLSNPGNNINEQPQFGLLQIAAAATPFNPIESGVVHINITVGPDPIKEGVEFFRLLLESNDECVCLGRDLSIATIPENGSKCITN